MITKHVLLIEDDHDDQEVFSMALREIDSAIICHTVDDALEGIDKLKQDPQFVPDMIFIDLNMPKMDGIGCVRELRTLPQIAGVPIFMYSTRNDARIVNETKELGVEFLVKPTSIATLINKLTALVTPR